LVAGCGTATRLDFKAHSRPASPVALSVYLGGGRARVDPVSVHGGLVVFNIANATARVQRVSLVAVAGGRRGRGVGVQARGVSVAAGGTAQLKAALSHAEYGVEVDGHARSMTLVRVRRPARTGNDQLALP